MKMLVILRDELGTRFDSIKPGDKPDFVVEHRGSVVGIEVTDGSTEEFRRGMKLAEAEGLRAFSMDGFEDRDKSNQRSPLELLEAMQDTGCSDVETSAIAWASRIAKRISRKCELLQKGEIKRQNSNWLLIYDFRSDDRSLAIDRYRDMLLGVLGPSPMLRKTFDVIYILSFDHLIMIASTFTHGHKRTRHQ